MTLSFHSGALDGLPCHKASCTAGMGLQKVLVFSAALLAGNRRFDPKNGSNEKRISMNILEVIGRLQLAKLKKKV